MPTSPYGYQPVAGIDGGPIPVTLDNGSVTIANVTVPTSVTVNNTSAAPVPVSDAGGTLSIDDGNGSITVDGPLTDTQLRAAAVPVSGPLTDTQLRASAVPVVGTVAARTPLTTSVAGTASSALVLAANANRKGLCVSNVSSGTILAGFSTVATSRSFSAAITSANETLAVQIQGTVSVNAGGTFIPQYILSAAPGGAYSVLGGSSFTIWPIGASGANTSVGPWA